MTPTTRAAARTGAALVAGLALWLSFPGANLCWLAPIAVALLGGAVLTTTGPRAFGLGLLAGLGFFVPTLSWSGVYVGRLPWFALATLEALYVAAQCVVTAVGARRLLARGRPLLAYAVVPLGWVVQELARGTTPFGGFPWAKLAFSQADGPLARYAALGGAPLVTFAVALVGAALLGAAHAAYTHRGPSRALRVALLVALLVPALALVVPVPTAGRPVTIAMVQGNVPRAGLDFNAERRAVLDNHVVGTYRATTRPAPGLSLVVWPENSSDIDPLRNTDAAEQVQRALGFAKVPILLGAVLAEPVGHSTNASLLYRPGGGAPERYTKIHVVPFAEYIPARDLFRRITPTADLAGHFVGGSRLGSFRIPAAGGAYTVLPSICFEVAYDGLLRDTVTQPGVGESLIVVQTNNATFGYTDESEQQLAISRIRAIEHGRSVAHISTVGVSAIIHPDGSTEQVTRLFTPAQIVGHPVVRSGSTVADRLGAAPDIAGVVLLLLLLALGSVHDRSGAQPRAPHHGGRADPDLQRA